MTGISCKLWIAILAATGFLILQISAQQSQIRQLDPASSDQSRRGKPAPELAGGDQCLFCHRASVGATWQADAHFLTIRDKYQKIQLAQEIEMLASSPQYKKFARQVDFVMGGKRAARFLRRGDDGRFEILSVMMRRERGRVEWSSEKKPGWDREKFADRCIGCHMTGVDSETLAPFESFVGCETCHGPYDDGHTNGSAFMRFSKKAKETPEMIASSCGSCHLRGGRSRSTGRPFANSFLSGDNLFKDFEFDLVRIDVGLNPIDQHIQRNISDIALAGKKELTCLSCHRMHPASSELHRRRPRTDYCLICHKSEPFKERKSFEVHSPVCEY